MPLTLMPILTRLFLFRPSPTTTTTAFPLSVSIFSPFHHHHRRLSLPKQVTTALSQSLSETTPYGPSLHKGRSQSPEKCPNQNELQDDAVCGEGDEIIDEESFTRVFNLAALRVPANYCSALERRLRGHLLNWPRVPNVARVPGDDFDDEASSVKNGVVGEGEEEMQRRLDTLNRRMRGKAEGDGDPVVPVLYRERLAREFDSRGFVKFRNLAKMSRPPRRKERKEAGREERRENKGGRKEILFVEVVEEEDRGEEWKGLLGEDFSGRNKWKGPTRLLLLDERLAAAAAMGVQDLPQAIKVASLL